MGGASQKRGWILFSILLLVSALLVGAVLWEPGPNQTGSPRADRLAEFRTEMNLADTQRLIFSPTLLSEIYRVGAVFPESGFGMAATLACDQVEATTVPMTVRLGAGKRYKIAPGAELAEGAAFELNGAKAVEYRLALKQAAVLPAEDALITALTTDADCLAAIVNVPVYVLYGVFGGDESYAISRSITGNLSLGAFLRLAQKKLGLSGSAEIDADFTRPDSNLIWALTRIHIVDDRFPTGPGTEAFRQAKAREVLREETDYFARAREMAEIAAPSPEELTRVLDRVAHETGRANEEKTE